METLSEQYLLAMGAVQDVGMVSKLLPVRRFPLGLSCSRLTFSIISRTILCFSCQCNVARDPPDKNLAKSCREHHCGIGICSKALWTTGKSVANDTIIDRTHFARQTSKRVYIFNVVVKKSTPTLTLYKRTYSARRSGC
jgi:hypothetical protein